MVPVVVRVELMVIGVVWVALPAMIPPLPMLWMSEVVSPRTSLPLAPNVAEELKVMPERLPMFDFPQWSTCLPRKSCLAEPRC